MVHRRTLITAAAATIAAPMLRAQTLQSLPNGPVRIIVGFPPGGGTDILARVLAPRLQELWKLTVMRMGPLGSVCARSIGAARVAAVAVIRVRRFIRVSGDFVLPPSPSGRGLG